MHVLEVFVLQQQGHMRDEDASCIDYAVCLNNKCICNSSYSPTSNGKCLMNYGMKCNNGQNETCNYEQGLACVNGTCACAGSYNEYVDGEGCVRMYKGAVCMNIKYTDEKCGNDIVRAQAEDHQNDIKYYIGCKAPLICTKDNGGISRCLLPGESFQMWIKQFGALK